MPHQLTPDQLALQAQRRAAKQAKQANKTQVTEDTHKAVEEGEEEDTRSFLRREWLDVRSTSPSYPFRGEGGESSSNGSAHRRGGGESRAKIVTWNVSLSASPMRNY